MRFSLSKNGKGYILGAIAASTYGLNPLFTLPLYAEGMNADSVLGYRYGIASLLLGVIMWLTHRTFRLTRMQIPLMALFAVLFAVSSLLLFESFRFMDAGVASTILFIYPVIVAVINAVFYGGNQPYGGAQYTVGHHDFLFCGHRTICVLDTYTYRR